MHLRSGWNQPGSRTNRNTAAVGPVLADFPQPPNTTPAAADNDMADESTAKRARALQKINVSAWLEENKDAFLPPVCNKLMLVLVCVERFLGWADCCSRRRWLLAGGAAGRVGCPDAAVRSGSLKAAAGSGDATPAASKASGPVQWAPPLAPPEHRGLGLLCGQRVSRS